MIKINDRILRELRLTTRRRKTRDGGVKIVKVMEARPEYEDYEIADCERYDADRFYWKEMRI